jgi:hypothetical protein
MTVTRPRLTQLGLAVMVLAVHLGCAGSPDEAASATDPVQVQPASVEVGPSDAVQFGLSVTQPQGQLVVWSVDEPEGGSIDAQGNYTAPATEGTYHVRATSVAQPTLSGEAAVTVTAQAPTPSGPQLFVSPSGNDSSPGTAAQPWRTIQKAMNAAPAGSTVNIKSGTYAERLSVNVSGAAGSYITFQPNGFTGPGTGESVILDYASFGNVTDGVPFLAINNRSYVRIQGLTFQNYQVRGAMQRGIWIHGSSSNVELKWNKVLKIQNNAPWDGSSALLNFWIDSPANSVWVYGNEFGYINSNYGEAMSPNAGNITIENNWFHDTDGIAIDVHPSAKNTIIRGNLLEWISKKRDGSVWYNNPANAVYVDGGNTVTIERNTVRDSEWAFAVLSEPSNPAAHDIIIRNNVAYRNYAGIEVGNWYSNTSGSSVYNVKVYNNTLFQCTNGLVIRPYSSSSVEWKNNIVWGSTTPVVNGLNWAVGTMDHNLTSNPLFKDPGAGDFTPQAGSPAINAGDPNIAGDLGAVDCGGNPRVVNGGLDIGAFEAQ